ncbi:hypothetical protein [Bosea sp. (in: a-proteobacteria)]|uniref:hypothetical protein n=1 Tax=Bosea sp. (in: a-proteobacteria) TaxID=1871050 RepID=UPI002FCC69DE
MSKLPPIPPENRSAKGPGEPDHAGKDAPRRRAGERPENSEQQGRHANIKQNTTHQGHQQDR